MTNHLVHFLFLGAAVVVFMTFVVVEVRRHGWPGFSWRGGDPSEPRP